MRKNLLISGMLLSAVIIFAACQKDQSTVSKQTASASSENTNIVGVAGEGTLPGNITPSYAGALAYNYSRKYDGANQTQYVAFSAADLIAFINNLKVKYGSDIIYVNFGVYGQGAAAANSKDNGRLTVFFTGNKIPAPTNNHKNDGITTDDQFLNHGGLVP